MGVRRTFRGHRDCVVSSGFNHNGKQLASGGAEGVVMIWNFSESMRAFRFAGHKVSFPMGYRCASARSDGNGETQG